MMFAVVRLGLLCTEKMTVPRVFRKWKYIGINKETMVYKRNDPYYNMVE